MFDGVGSPITQTFGLGLFSPPTDAQLDEIEAFFRDRGAEVFHEVSPLADPAVLAMLPSAATTDRAHVGDAHAPNACPRPARASRRSARELTVAAH